MLLVICSQAPTLHAQTAPQPELQPLPVPERVQYQSFQLGQLTRYAWKGKHVAFLTPKDDLDPDIMGRILQAVDAGFEFCVALTGKPPAQTPRYTIEGRNTIAAVPGTCGAGCGKFGQAGIELEQGQFDALYNGVRDKNEYSGLPFYELGRNFWFYGDQTNGIASTGYAVLIGYLSVKASGVRCSGFRGQPIEVFRQTLEGMVDAYVATPELNFETSVLADKGPPNALGLGGTDVWASFIIRLQSTRGPKWTPRFFEALKKRPRARNQQEGIDNLILAACSAADADLSPGFIQTWRWPMSQGAQEEARRLFDTPLEDGNGLKAEYFRGKDLRQISGTRIDPDVDFDWDFAWSPAPEGMKGVSSDYSARWSGQVKAEGAGLYTFSVDGDDGFRLWVKGQLLIDQWRDQFGEHQGTIILSKNEMADIKLEYFQTAGGQNIKLIWQGPGIPRQIVPQDRLFTP